MLKSDQKIGIITADSRSLTRKHLACVGADLIPTAIVGTEDEDFSEVLIENELTLDIEI